MVVPKNDYIRFVLEAHLMSNPICVISPGSNVGVIYLALAYFLRLFYRLLVSAFFLLKNGLSCINLAPYNGMLPKG